MAEEQQGDASGADSPSERLGGFRVGMTGRFDVGVQERVSRATLRGQMIVRVRMPCNHCVCVHMCVRFSAFQPRSQLLCDTPRCAIGDSG